MHTNFLKHNFKHYYAQDSDGAWDEVTRAYCVTYDIATSFTGRYPQRWYYDFASDYIVRLSRDAAGEQLYNAVRYLRRRESKLLSEQYGCVGDDCPKCKGWKEVVDGEIKCERCPKRVVFVELDKEQEDEDDGMTNRLEMDAGIDISRDCETSFLIETLHAVLDTFGNDERKLWKCLAAEMRKKDIALMFGWTLKQLEYYESKLYAKLRADRSLKNFFEK